MRKFFIDRAPSRERLLKNRWLAPVASRLAPVAIWQFNRRSIARGVALGLFAGFILPIGQIILAVLFAASVRANVLVASAATLVTNPLTFPPIYYAAYRTGAFVLDRFASQGEAADAAAWMTLSTASLATFIGLVLFATLSSLIAYVAVHLAWRLSLIRRWRRRHQAR